LRTDDRFAEAFATRGFFADEGDAALRFMREDAGFREGFFERVVERFEPFEAGEDAIRETSTPHRY
jgi:hypothetical protein